MGLIVKARPTTERRRVVTVAVAHLLALTAFVALAATNVADLALN